MTKPHPTHHPQYRLFIGLSLLIAVSAGIVYVADAALFQPYFGRIHPLLVLLLVTLLGAGLVSILLTRAWFSMYKKENRKGLFIAAGLSGLLGLIMIGVDLQGVFPDDINAPFPESLLFYPVMGYVVEVLFHLLPLTLLLTGLSSFFHLRFEQIVWPCIFLVSILEPVFQTILGTPNAYPIWAEVYIALHIFGMNLLQLWLFKRYDFLTMYSFRLVYYLIWHIAWGYLRLAWLF